MNIFSQIKVMPSMLMNKFSSVLAAEDAFASFMAGDNFVTRILRIFLQILYFASKWVMYMVDVIYFYILQLAGVSADTSVFDSASTDMTFRMLIDNKELVTTIIKNFIAIAVVLVLVTAIIALIKQQATAFKSKKAKKNPTGDVLKGVFKSFLLLILTPLIAIVSIVASSVLLQALFNATNLSNSKSLSARVFNASAAAANKYKSYAENGVRIPIKYKFTGDRKESAISYTATMVGKSAYPKLSYFNENEISGGFRDPIDLIENPDSPVIDVNNWLNNTYYVYYDSSEDYKPNGGVNKYKLLTTHVNEYYAMSDVIMYAMDTMEPYYFITVQELLSSVSSGSVEDNERFKNLVDGYNIRLLDSSENVIGGDGVGGYATMRNAFVNGNYQYIRYTSKYADGTHTYVHIKDAVDEFEGAKFIIGYKNEYDGGYQGGLYGNYIETALGSGSFEEITSFYYKSGSRYKTVELYYRYNADKDKYEKATSYNNSETYYYRLGETYVEVKSEDKTKFYVKTKNGNNYKKITFGSSAELFSKTTKYFYSPLANGVAVDKNTTFTSQYIGPSSLITAKGIFDKSSYPTAIRKLSNGNVVFYRDDLELVANGSVSDAATIDQIEVEGGDEEENKNFFQKVGSAISGVWSSIKKFVSSIFNPAKLVPDLTIDTSKMSTTYTNKTNVIYNLEEGKLHIGYFFSDSIMSNISKELAGLDINYLFDPMNINYIILVVGSVAFLKICINSVFALINRSLNLLMMFLIYPIACSTLPLDEVDKVGKNGSYAKWLNKYLQLIYSTFGIILGMNFVFVIIPVIDQMEFFTPESMVRNKALARVANALYNPWLILGSDIKTNVPNYDLICKYLNKLLRIIFEIAAFSVIVSTDKKSKGGKTFYTVIQEVVGKGAGAFEDSPLDAVKKTLKSTTQVFNAIFFPHKFVKNQIDKVKNSTETLVKNLPFSAVISEHLVAKNERKIKDAQKEAKANLEEAIKMNADPKVVQERLTAYGTALNQ